MRHPPIISFFIPHLGCTSNCIFCNQKTITGQGSAPSADDVVRGIEAALPFMSAAGEVAFFGGSFTALSLSRQEMYLRCVQPYIDKGRISGIRVSTRPDAIDDAILDTLMDYRVRTVELGVQSMDPGVLMKAGRDYGPSVVENASRMIKERGFTLGHQLMIGLPLSSPDKELSTVRKVVQMAPHVVRIYPTLVIRGTALADLFLGGEYAPLSLEEAIMLSALMFVELQKSGIRVIRMGLQSTPDLRSVEEVLAGPFHPAFGELVYGKIMKWQASQLLKRFLSSREASSVRLYVDPRDISKMVGAHRAHIKALEQEHLLRRIEVKGFESTRSEWVGVSSLECDHPEDEISRTEFLNLFQQRAIGEV